MNQNMKSGITSMKTMTAEAPADLCEEIQVCHVSFDAQKEVIASMIEQHAKDLTDRITKSCIFQSYLRMAADSLYDWECAKATLEETMFGESAKNIVEWSLDYTTKTLTYTEAASIKLVEKQESVSIDKETVDKIQTAHTMYDCINHVITFLSEVHADDVVDIITGSPVFEGFQQLFFKAKKDWEDAKTAMLNNLPDGLQSSMLETWSLNYQTKTLTYTRV